MANEQDLVKEIEEAEDFIGGYIRIRAHPTEVTVSMDCLVNIRATLQRAREALRWIPCEERLPEKIGDYFVSIRFPFPDMDEPFTKPAYFKDGKWHERNPDTFKTWEVEHVIAWQPKPAPYTPEES